MGRGEILGPLELAQSCPTLSNAFTLFTDSAKRLSLQMTTSLDFPDLCKVGVQPTDQ